MGAYWQRVRHTRISYKSAASLPKGIVRSNANDSQSAYALSPLGVRLVLIVHLARTLVLIRNDIYRALPKILNRRSPACKDWDGIRFNEYKSKVSPCIYLDHSLPKYKLPSRKIYKQLIEMWDDCCPWHRLIRSGWK